MSEPGVPRLLGVTIDHPGEVGCLRGETSTVSLMVDRRLKSGKVDVVPLSEDDLIRLVAKAADCLQILRGLR